MAPVESSAPSYWSELVRLSVPKATEPLNRMVTVELVPNPVGVGFEVRHVPPDEVVAEDPDAGRGEAGEVRVAAAGLDVVGEGEAEEIAPCAAVARRSPRSRDDEVRLGGRRVVAAADARPARHAERRGAAGVRRGFGAREGVAEYAPQAVVGGGAGVAHVAFPLGLALGEEPVEIASACRSGNRRSLAQDDLVAAAPASPGTVEGAQTWEPLHTSSGVHSSSTTHGVPLGELWSATHIAWALHDSPWRHGLGGAALAADARRRDVMVEERRGIERAKVGDRSVPAAGRRGEGDPPREAYESSARPHPNQSAHAHRA